MRVLAQARPEPIAVGAAALGAALVAGTFVAAILAAPARGASVVAAGAFLFLVAIGVSLYAWRLGVPGRSD